jgi:hypothetical protein
MVIARIMRSLDRGSRGPIRGSPPPGYVLATDLRGDDRNRTGVNGFAVLPEVPFSAYLSGFRGPQVLSDAPKKRSNGEPLGSRRRGIGYQEVARYRNLVPRGSVAGYPRAFAPSPSGKATSRWIVGTRGRSPSVRAGIRRDRPTRPPYSARDDGSQLARAPRPRRPSGGGPRGLCARGTKRAGS